MLSILPTFGAKPSTGFAFGVAANLAVYFGEPATTPISSAVVSGSFSTKKQTSVLARVAAAGSEDRRRLVADYRFQWTSQDTFGLGTSTGADDGVNARFTYIRLFQTAYFGLGKGIKGGVGVHYGVHSDIRPGEDAELTWDQSSLVEYSTVNGLELQEQTSAGFSLNLLRDTRDHQINASRGWFGSVSFRPYFKDVLGGDSVWQEVLFDVRAYTKVKGDGRHKLAFWLYGDFVTDGVAPYLDLPSIGADTYGRTGRGYEEGRFRGERLLYGEVEYRATLTKQRPARHGGVRQHHHGEQPAGRPADLRQLRPGRGRRPARPVQQAGEDQPLRRLRLRRGRIARPLPGAPGSVLTPRRRSVASVAPGRRSRGSTV